MNDPHLPEPVKPPPIPDYGRQRPARPWWVDLGMIGVPTRGTALAYFWLSIILAIISIPVSFYYPIAIYGGGFLLAAGAYWACISWIDRHDDWK